MSTMPRKAAIPVPKGQLQQNGQMETKPGSTAEAIQERVRVRAYEIYESRTRNGGAGDETADWAQAEREVIGAGPESAARKGLEIKTRTRGEELLAGEK